MCKFVLKQHGETDMNQSGRIGGDGDLSERGQTVSQQKFFMVFIFVVVIVQLAMKLI